MRGSSHLRNKTIWSTYGAQMTDRGNCKKAKSQTPSPRTRSKAITLTCRGSKNTTLQQQTPNASQGLFLRLLAGKLRPRTCNSRVQLPNTLSHSSLLSSQSHSRMFRITEAAQASLRKLSHLSLAYAMVSGTYRRAMHPVGEMRSVFPHGGCLTAKVQWSARACHS